jgi:hypothetical protein
MACRIGKVGTPDRSRPVHVSPDPEHRTAARHATGWIRRVARTLGTAALSPLAFRLSVGRWPDSRENRQFASAMRDTGLQIPAIPRALIASPAARQQVSNMIMFHLMAEGFLPKPQAGGIAPRLGNPLVFWRGEPVSFLHFERTAGTTLATMLTEKFHPLQIATAPLPLDVPDTDHLLDGIDDHKLVWGHYDLPGFRRLAPRRRIITLLREPTQRILSLYYFWRSIHPSQLALFEDSRVERAHTLGLLDFLHSDHPPIRDSIDNVYVRRLAGLNGGATANDPLAQNPQAALASALSALQHVAFVGIVEHMGETLAGMGDVLCTDLGTMPPRLNDSTENSTHHPAIYRHVEREELTPDIRHVLARLTRLDQVIYRTCLDTLVPAQGSIT